MSIRQQRLIFLGVLLVLLAFAIAAYFERESDINGCRRMFPDYTREMCIYELEQKP